LIYIPKKIAYFLIVALGLFLSSPVSAIEDVKIESGAKLSIADCINTALRNNPTIRKYKYQWQISKGNVGLAKSAYSPTISLGAGFSKTYNSNHDSSTSSRTFPSVDVKLRELIWDFGRTFADIKMEKFYLLAAKYDYENISWVIMYDVKINYFKVLAAKATVEVEECNVKMTERNYQRVKAYFDEGIRSKIDLVNAEANLSDARIKLIKAQNAYKTSIVTLNNSMYIKDAPDYELETPDSFNFSGFTAPLNLLAKNYEEVEEYPEDIEDAKLVSKVEKTDILGDYKIPEFKYTFDECYETANKNRCDLHVLRETANAMEEALKVTRRQYYPQLSASGGYNYYNRDKFDNNSFSIGLNLETSINPLRVKHELDIGKLKIDIAKNEVDLLSKDIYFDLQRYFVEMRELERQIPVMAAKVRQTLENLELADGRYEVGLADYIELQDARVNYNNAQVNYILTVFNYNVARTQVEQTMAISPNGTFPLVLE